MNFYAQNDEFNWCSFFGWNDYFKITMGAFLKLHIVHVEYKTYTCKCKLLN